MKIVYNYEELPKLKAGSYETGMSYVNKLRTYSVYGILQGDSFYRAVEYWCHRPLFGRMDKTITDIQNWFTTQLRPTQTEFINFLLSPDSPYSDLFKDDDIFLLREEKTERPLAIHFTNVQEKYWHLLANFLICSRLGSSWGLDLVWKALVDSGVNPSYALGLCVFFSLNGQCITNSSSRDERVSSESLKGLQLVCCNPHSGDQPFDLDISFKKLSGKKYQKVDRPSRHYGVCNFIWNKTKYTAIPSEILIPLDAFLSKKKPTTTSHEAGELARQCAACLLEEKSLPKELVKAIHDLK